MLRLLGGTAIEDGAGEPLALSSRRHPLALLALLSVAPGRTLSRAKLVGYLWPEASEETARNRLATYVHQTRQALGEGVLSSVGDDLRLGGSGLEADVWNFREAVEAEDFHRAVEIYTGPFLDGFFLEGSSSFEKWADRHRERLRRLYREALEALADSAESRGETVRAAEWWHELAEEDPFDSRVVLRTMRALAAAGNRAKALRVGADHAAALREELGVRPGDALRSELEELRRERGEEEERAAGEIDRGSPASTVAVLPFENLTGTEDAGIFAAGLHDDLLTELSRLPGLTVISRTSVIALPESGLSIQEIGERLGAGTVVEGAVQISEDRVRLNVQVIEAQTDAHRWVERYDRELTPENLFEIQGELARKIARTLEGELVTSDGAPTRKRRGSPGDLESYRLYLQGRGLADQRTEEATRRAVDYFRRAIESDPEFALAWAGLADTLSLLEFYDYPGPDSAPDPLAAARQAVELNPEIGETHSSLGTILAIRRKGAPALRELERAVELSPSYADGFTWLAWVHLLRGSPEAALEPARRAVELDPLAPALRAYLAEVLLANGQTAEALSQAVGAREIQPGYGLPHYVEALVLYHRGETEAAGAAARRALRLVPPDGTPTHSEVRALLAVIHAGAGDESEARRLLSRILDRGPGFDAGLVMAALGEEERALEAFESLGTWGSFETEALRYFFPEVLGPLRAEPRYRAVVASIDDSWREEDEAGPTAS